MRPDDFQTPAQKRTFANGIAVLTLLMVAAVVLEYNAGWELQQIGTSILSFFLVLLVAIGRFASRSSAQQSGMQEKLFITAMWYFVVGLIAKALASRPVPAQRDSAARDNRDPERRQVRTDVGEVERETPAPHA